LSSVGSSNKLLAVSLSLLPDAFVHAVTTCWVARTGTVKVIAARQTSLLNLRSGPSGDKQQRSKKELFDHLVGTGEQRRLYGKTERLGGLQIDHQLVLYLVLYRQVAGFGTFEDTIDIGRSAAIRID
jgi:hypothetical protein